MHDILITASACLLGCGLVMLLGGMYSFLNATRGWPEKRPDYKTLIRSNLFTGFASLAFMVSLALAVHVGLGKPIIAITAFAAFFAFVIVLQHGGFSEDERLLEVVRIQKVKES